MPPLRYQDLDWNLLRQQAQLDKSWQPKGESDWDCRAAAFAKRTEKSLYTHSFFNLLKPEKDWSILDVGSGPGTLALPLAPMVKHITCIDFSANMLQILENRASKQHITNISTCKASWTDEWRQYGIRPHDVVIASRSLAVNDLRSALLRLSEFARKKVVITDRVHHGPFDPDAFAAVGRPLNTGPDYIYTLNLLYQLGQLATVDFIRIEENLHYASLDDAFSRYAWMFRDLSTTETNQLRKYIGSIAIKHEDGSFTLRGRHVPTWAYISWHPTASRI
jgi:SAM-dependent methyltransferase